MVNCIIKLHVNMELLVLSDSDEKWYNDNNPQRKHVHVSPFYMFFIDECYSNGNDCVRKYFVLNNNMLHKMHGLQHINIHYSILFLTFPCAHDNW